jgi:hypothetical protein
MIIPTSRQIGERMIRQSVGGLAVRSCALQGLARDRTQNRVSTFADRALKVTGRI